MLFPRQVHALFVVIAVLGAADDFRDDRLNRRLDTAREDAVQRIIIPGRDGIELVVVATSAGDGQAEKTFGHHVDPIVDDVVLHLHEPLANSEETECRQIGRVLASGQ